MTPTKTDIFNSILDKDLNEMLLYLKHLFTVAFDQEPKLETNLTLHHSISGTDSEWLSYTWM